MPTDNERIEESVRTGLHAPDGESEPGQCWRFLRLRIKKVFGNRWPCPPVGSDANQALEWYRRKGMVLPKGANTLPGDLFFWPPTKRNPHGHVAMRCIPNCLCENWTPHAKHNHGDARGSRKLPKSMKGIEVVRIRRKPAKGGV